MCRSFNGLHDAVANLMRSAHKILLEIATLGKSRLNVHPRVVAIKRVCPAPTIFA